MRCPVVVPVLALLLSVAVAASDDPPPPLPWTHVRCLSHGSRGLVRDAASRSAIVRGLMDELERSDVVAFVELVPYSLGSGRAQMQYVGSGAGIRYVIVKIEAWSVVYRFERIAWLAHELQHAVEVAEARDVRDAESFDALYARIGRPSGDRGYETERAVATGRRVWLELNS